MKPVRWPKAGDVVELADWSGDWHPFTVASSGTALPGIRKQGFLVDLETITPSVSRPFRIYDYPRWWRWPGGRS